MPTHAATAALPPALPLGQVLRARRKALGITAAAAAEAAGMSRVTWHRLEKGEPTVALGSLQAAARVLGLELALQVPGAGGPAMDKPAGASLPLRIRLADYPQLRRLAWQVADANEVLSPREVLGLYERNWRYLQPESLGPEERALIDALREVYGADDLRV